MRCAVLALAVSFVLPHAWAQVDQVVTAKLERYSIGALVSRQEGAKTFKQGIAIFPGHPGILKLHEENGQAQYEQRGNFLVRARRHWLDDETLVAVLDAPSDQWSTFTQDFRATPRYGTDVAAVLNEVSKLHPVADWTFVGTSEGSVSAFHAARMNPKLARRVILTASVFEASRNGPGLSRVNFGELRSDLLWVHHADDPCAYTPYRAAQAFAKKSNAPLVTVRGGGGWSGDLCQARTAHGFVGIEVPTVQAMRGWVK